MIPPGLRIAARQLTVWPLAWDAREQDALPASAVMWFPVIGLAIGSVVAATLLLPLQPGACAALALAVWIVASGGLHEDAVMDCADAAIPPIEQSRRLEILKDPHVGAHGVTAVGLLLLLRFAALVDVSAMAALAAVIAGRWCMAITVAHGRPARDGLGARFAAGAPGILPTAVALIVLGALALFDWITVAAALPGTLLGIGTGHALARRLGGYSGDVHGAAGVLAETATLYAALLLSAP
jgi:adenosylcobinamide-GDP ribazoletransferase